MRVFTVVTTSTVVTPFFRTLVPAFVGLIWASQSALGLAQQPPACGSCVASVACVSLPRPQDEMWLVSSRGVGCGELENGGQPLAYWRNETSQGWVASTQAAWSAGDPTVHVSIFVHGNDITAQRAVEGGWAVYGDLIRSAPEQPPVRFVIYSWPADKVRGLPAENVRVKCARSDVDARYLAGFIDRLDPQTPLSLAGYSLGARIVGGALQLTAGGTLDGRAMSVRLHPNRDPVRVVLMASAIDSDWLLPGRRFGLAIGQMQHLLLLNNTCDRSLRFYHRIYCKHGGPEALGYTEMPSPQLLGDQRGKLEQIDVCCLIGPEHNWEHYTGTAAVANSIGRGLLAAPESTPATPDPNKSAGGNSSQKQAISASFPAKPAAVVKK